MKIIFNNGSILVLLCCIVLISFVSCADKEMHDEGEKKEDHAVHWGYETDDGPAKWGSMDPDWILCAEGLSQSPVDLTKTQEIKLAGIKIDVLSGQEVELLNQTDVLSELDNGHTIQVNAKTGETMLVGGKEYALVQFHFHAPSEHTVNGEHFPMEMHFVTQAEDGALAVIGVFLKEGAHNPGIEPLWQQLGHEPGKAEIVKIPADFDDYIFPEGDEGIYHYDGSLTTPPCSEGVKWYIRKTPAQLSKEQIEAFREKYDHNNRPVQALNKRTLFIDKNSKITVR